MEQSTNPKDKFGRMKPPLHLIPSSALIHEAMAMGNGADKYGPFNWRKKTVDLMIYVGAMKRHVESFVDREDLATDSGVHHLGHARACLGIMLDAIETGNAVDTRPPAGPASRLLEQLTRKDGPKEPTGKPPIIPDVIPFDGSQPMYFVGGFPAYPGTSCGGNGGSMGSTGVLVGGAAGGGGGGAAGGGGGGAAEASRYNGDINAIMLVDDARKEWEHLERVKELIKPDFDYRRNKSGRVFYVAGPMRGIEEFNFPSFDRARDLGFSLGHGIISPADIDRKAGFKEKEVKQEDKSVTGEAAAREFAERDAMALLSLRGEYGHGIALLPGWEKSTGAVAEFFFARWLGLYVVDARTFEPFAQSDFDSIDHDAFRANMMRFFLKAA